VLEFIIQTFINCSTCFERHTAHHQELKNWQLWQPCVRIYYSNVY